MLRSFKYAFSLFVLFLLLFMSLQAISGERPYEIKTGSEVLVIGDVHGAYDELVSLLSEAGIIDDKLSWIGEDKHLVSLGDLIDRGPRSRDVLDLMIKLQAQAPESGGEVHVILGNHELMVMIGDRRYVTQADYFSFAGDETSEDRDRLRQEYLADHNDENEIKLNEDFNKLYPEGYSALDKAFSAEGYIGRWLLDQPIMLKINDTVFVHGGIPSKAGNKSLEEINKSGKSELRTYLDIVERLREAGILPGYVDYYDRIPYLNKKAKKLIDTDPDIKRNSKKRPSWFNDLIDLSESQNTDMFSNNNLLWYRGTSMCHVFTESFTTEKFLTQVNAGRVVIGHTPTQNRRVTERMDGLVLMLDTGMLKDYYRGRQSLLIIDKDNIYVRYGGNPDKVDPVKEERSLSRKLSGMSDSELEDFLLNGEITRIKLIGTGITKPKKVTLQKGDKTINAVFKTRDTAPGIQNSTKYNLRRNNNADRYVYDVAAYRLDRLLDLQMVPVAILREIDGKEGVLQYWVENSINERDRLKTKKEFEGQCNKNQQYWLRFIFDILIYNEDRNLTNILWSKDEFMLMFIDHSLAFRVIDNRPKQYRKVPLYVSDFVKKKLLNLNNENLTKELSSYLHPQQISSILKRRDLILKDRISTE